MTDTECALILSRLEHLERCLIEKRILTKAGLYLAILSANALGVAMYVGVYLVCRAMVGAG